MGVGKGKRNDKVENQEGNQTERMPCGLMRKHNMHPSPWHSRLDYFNCLQELAVQGILNSQLLNNFRNS